MSWIHPTTLHGKHATLAPLTQAHCLELEEAVKDGELWKLWYTSIPTPENMEKEIQRRLDAQAAEKMIPFVIIDNKTQQAAGMTSYYHIDHTSKRLDIGWTWYRKSVQKTALNTECKLMLLTHAFEILNCIAVGFRVNFLNHPSRRAVERLGAKLDGILRNEMVVNGSIRDICVYSILPNEWPNVKTQLEFKLSQHTSTAIAVASPPPIHNAATPRLS